MTLSNTTAIILAAGSGTRMKSSKPKVIHEVLGKPLIRWVVDTARQAGVEQIICVLGHKRNVVEPFVEADTTVVIQNEQKGTADAVAVCRGAVSSSAKSVLVLNGDCPLITPKTLNDLVEAREASNAGVAVLTMEAPDPHGYGRIVRDAGGMVERIVEQKDCDELQDAITECNSGFYCFDASMLFDALEQVGSNNSQNEFYLTDVVEIARANGRATIGVKAEDVNECLGVNTRIQLAEATKILQLRINHAHMLDGVTIIDPHQAWIGPDVVLENDIEIWPQTFLAGNTHIGEGTVIGYNSRMFDTDVGAQCNISETVAIEAVIEDGCTCGPRAYLRPGAHLCKGAKVGTHVEIKKSVVGPGSKVPHLSYIGDATIGEDVNIGAGTITCNYDGTNKHATIIGDKTFIGSDTMLVAPVTVGSDVVVGAGSVITDDVPDGALALGRAQQLNKEGYTQSHKPKE
ncbi:MAG: bifunctional UDP-N-acetylglucosamine diphosphorylase/glucosamine-1-phosphate N-acetyltransferase GlmU [Eggerthellaceae bacterium]|nr:bifunctional UDP-N-acetylglucosamine diphosphorylase/glucosamine-1-phosphate N-acetyltransferase GlmU [Eggerthellaceae bacterium]